MAKRTHAAIERRRAYDRERYATDPRRRAYNKACARRQWAEIRAARAGVSPGALQQERADWRASCPPSPGRRHKASPARLTAGHYERSRRWLETLWGPYTRWTAAQHHAHTNALRACCGMPVLPAVIHA